MSVAVRLEGIMVREVTPTYLVFVQKALRLACFRTTSAEDQWYGFGESITVCRLLQNLQILGK